MAGDDDLGVMLARIARQVVGGAGAGVGMSGLRGVMERENRERRAAERDRG